MIIYQVSDQKKGVILAPEKFFLLHFYFLSIIGLHKKLGVSSHKTHECPNENRSIVAILLCF